MKQAAFLFRRTKGKVIHGSNNSEGPFDFDPEVKHEREVVLGRAVVVHAGASSSEAVEASRKLFIRGS